MSAPHEFTEEDLKLASYIDHTVVRSTSTQDEVEKVCQEAIENHFCSVCVSPPWVSFCVEYFKNTEKKPNIATVIGFPYGNHEAEVKGYETRLAVENGANEIDMVINLQAVKSAQWDKVEKDVKAVVDAAHPTASVKVIIETGVLTDEEKVKCCEICKAVGADFVKTSTGFNGHGATVEDIKLMRKTIGPDMGIKASGGVRSRDDANKMIEAGATRIGTSTGVKILRNLAPASSDPSYGNENDKNKKGSCPSGGDQKCSFASGLNAGHLIWAGLIVAQIWVITKAAKAK